MSILNVFESLQKNREYKRREDVVLTIPYDVRCEFRKFISDSCVDIRDGILTKVLNVHLEMACALDYTSSLVENMYVCPEDYNDAVYEIRTYLMEVISRFENSMKEIGAEEVLTANYIKYVLEKEYVGSYLEAHPQYKEYEDLLIGLFYGAIADTTDTLEAKYEDIHNLIGFFKEALEEFRRD